MRPATSAGIRTGPGRVPSSAADLLQGGPDVRAQGAGGEVVAHIRACASGRSSPRSRSEISATSGCLGRSCRSSMSLLAHLRPSRHPVSVRPCRRWDGCPLRPVPSPASVGRYPRRSVRRWVRGAGAGRGRGRSGSSPCRSGRRGSRAASATGIALHVHEDQRGPLFRGEGARAREQLAVQVLALRRGLGGLVRVPGAAQPLGLGDGRGAAGGGLAGPVQTGVHRDAVQPGGDGGLAAEGVGGADRRRPARPARRRRPPRGRRGCAAPPPRAGRGGGGRAPRRRRGRPRHGGRGGPDR